jgi:hypothetical protein
MTSFSKRALPFRDPRVALEDEPMAGILDGVTGRW